MVWFGATMEFGRSAPAALDSNQLRGHLQQIENSAALTAVLTILAVVTRARGARFQRALTQTDLLEPPGRRCGCWSTSPFRFSGLLVVWFGATMEFGRSAPAALDSNQLRGHLQQIENSAALTVGRLLSLARRSGAGAALNDHRKLAVLTILAVVTRA